MFGPAIPGVRGSPGISVDFLPHVRKDSTDLTAIVKLTEAVTNQPDISAPTWPAETISIRTNCEIAARLQIPKDSSVFFLETRSHRADGKRCGMIISTEPPGNGSAFRSRKVMIQK